MKNQPNQTSELQINLAKFEELAEEFIKTKSSTKVLRLNLEEHNLHALSINEFKNFIFSDQINKEKHKEEYFKLKEQLESMKAEFEPELVKEDEITYSDCEGDYIAVKEGAYQNCDGCAFANRSCGEVIESYSCGEHKIIWVKK